MEVIASARYMRITPRKARLVAATVVGLPVKDALVVLQFTPRAAAKEVAKVVKSAAANASNNFNQDEDALLVKSIIVNEGPTIKRGRARARGMYASIFKRTCHIIATVDTESAITARRRPAAPVAAAPAQPKAAKPKAEKATKPKAEKAAEVDAVEETPVVEKSAEVEAPAQEQRAAEAEAEAAEVQPPSEATGDTTPAGDEENK